MSAPRKNKKNGRDSGLSLGTIFLILLTLTVAALCVFLIFQALNGRKNPIPDLTDHPTTGKELSDGFSTNATGVSKTPSANPHGSSLTPPVDPSLPPDTPTPSDSPTFTPSEASPTPDPSVVSPTPSKNSETDTSKIYMNVPSDSDKLTLRVGKEEKVCTVSYFLPQLTVPGNRALQDKINADLSSGMKKAVERVRDSLLNNFDPDFMEPFSESIEVNFHKSAHTLSVVLIYPIIAGNGETVPRILSLNYDAATGGKLSVDDLLLNRTEVVNAIKRNIDGGDEPDFSILESSALCDGWYIEGTTLTVLYGGRRIDRMNPRILSVDLSGDELFRS